MNKEIMIEELRKRYIESYFEDSLLGNTLSFIEDLQQRIDKAIEYIKECGCYEEDTKVFCDDIDIYELPKLLEILKGGKND